MPVKDELLELRDLRDLLDRVMDKGIVLDAANRIGLGTREHLDHDQIVVGSFDTGLDQRPRATSPESPARPRSG